MTSTESEIALSGAYLYVPGQAERRWTGDIGTDFLATGDTTNGAFCMIDETAPRGSSVPLHRHARDLESLYVVEGELCVFLDGGLGQSAAAGAFAHIPAGAIHGFRVTSESARYLLLTTPHHGEFYRAISRPSGPGGAQPAQPIEEAEIMAACETYHIDFIGPLPPEDD